MQFPNGRFWLACLLGVVALPGCGGGDVGPCVPVQGVVTLGDQPLIGGSISFVPLEPEGNPPWPQSTIDSQGHYRLMTKGKEGAPVGKYRVTVLLSGADKIQRGQFNSVYSNPKNSPLEWEVKENAPAENYNFRLEPLPAR